MKSFEEIQKCWKEQKGVSDNAVILSETALTKLIRSGVKKEQKLVWEYCIASGFWQWLVYASLTHFIIRFWGDWQFMISCLAVILLYIPFTVMFIKKFRNMRMVTFNKADLRSQNIHATLKTQYKMLHEFFSFKKKFDWLNIPFCCIMIVMILYKYGMIPSFKENIAASVSVFLVYALLFVIAIYVENGKRFKVPLQKLDMVIREMEEDKSNEV